MKLILALLAFFLGFSHLGAQVPKDITLPITATVGANNITLNWANPGNADLLVLRRTKGQSGMAWVVALNVTGSNATTIVDNGVAPGQTYEYVVQRTIAGFSAIGYAHVAMNAPVVNSRGKILIFVDSTTADAAGVELIRLKNDMRGDGWWPIPFKVGPAATPQSVKAQIVQAYNEDPLNVKAVLLIGDVPIPYSGNTNWDGHPEHAGAWPSDAYYADVNGTWTDVTVNNTSPARAANVNVPGDGKFDQSVIPSPCELQVGRIDFRRINAPAFGAPDKVALLKRYLLKNHRWRNGLYEAGNKALVDDNFGFFGGEAFAANGYRNAYPLVGEANVIAADFFNDTDNQSFLMGYGCGAGTYTSASGVGSSTNFATDSVNIVFSNLFGSYHGDWDFENNPFMPSALASRGGILTCSWAGRPHHFYQALASGETIGYVMLETINAPFNNGFYQSLGEGGTHVALLGDPTLRAHVVKPATQLSAASSGCNSVTLNWTAAAEAVTGYHVYRALSQDGPYTRLTINPVTGTTYTDNSPILDTLYYQVRAVKNVSSPGGGTYTNNATGPIVQHVFVGGGGPALTTIGGTLNCNAFSVQLQANSTSPVTSWLWAGPNDFSSTDQNPTVNIAGTYTVTATDASGCASTATAVVTNDFNAPTINATVSNGIGCALNTATITVDATGLTSCTISGPLGFFEQGFSATVSNVGTYTITAFSSTNGCIGNTTVEVVVGGDVPSVTASNSGAITCAQSASLLSANSDVSNASFVWEGPCLDGNNALCAGTYTVTVTNPANGCTNTASTTVSANLQAPVITVEPVGTITCAVTSVPLQANTEPISAIEWSGPCLIPTIPPEAACAGNYIVVATGTNGCTSSQTVTVVEDKGLPTIILPPMSDLTCSKPCAVVTVPPIPGIQLYFMGQPIPPGFVFEICQPGVYVLEARSLLNGCSTDVPVMISQNITPPDVNAGPDKLISCSSATVQLNGSSSTPGVTYQWNGPGGATYSGQNPIVSTTGTYTLVVTDPVNGCTASDEVIVSYDPDVPVLNPFVSGVITCAVTSVTLNTGYDNPAAIYFWTGPNNFTSTSPTPVVTEPGLYAVSVTLGSCAVAASVEVISATDLDAEISAFAYNCDGTVSLCVNAFGGTPPYNFAWSDGSDGNCAILPGNAPISVSITDAGGCSISNQTVVVTPYPMGLVINATLNCSNTAILCAVVSGGIPPYTYTWANGETGNCLTTNLSGTFSVTVTDANGCTVATNATIVQPPTIGITGIVTNESAPNANNGAIDISVIGGSGGLFTYFWSNGATTQDLSNLMGGVYTVTVVDAATGCSAIATFQVSTASGIAEANVFKRLLLLPNPTSGLASLSVKLHQTSALRLDVRDASGRLVWEMAEQRTDELQVPIDLSNMPAGVYHIWVWIENQAFVRKLSVIK